MTSTIVSIFRQTVQPWVNTLSHSSHARPAPNPNPAHTGHALRLNRRTEKTMPKETPRPERIRMEERQRSHFDYQLSMRFYTTSIRNYSLLRYPSHYTKRREFLETRVVVLWGTPRFGSLLVAMNIIPSHSAELRSLFYLVARQGREDSGAVFRPLRVGRGWFVAN